MTLHIKRVVAAMAAVLMLLTLVPTAALPTIQFPSLSAQSTATDTSANDANKVPADDVVDEHAPATDAGETPVTEATTENNTSSANADETPANNAATAPSTDASANNADVTPSTDASANDADTVPSTDASANDADAAPSTDASANDADTAPSTDASVDTQVQEDVVTDPDIIEEVITSEDGVVIDDDNTVYTDIDNDGDIEAVQGTVIEDDEDFNPVNEIEDLLANVEQGKVEDTEYLDATAASSAASPYEPLVTNDATDPFLPGGDAWIDQDKIYYGAPASPTFPFTDWAANTSFLNTSAYEYDEDGRATKWVYPDVDLIDADTFGSTHKIGSASEGYAYNRNDAAYGKYGITIDRNRATTEWTVNKTVHLSETPYLAFSIEQVDKAKLAMAVRIGTPVNPKSISSGYTYRWYTITDSNEHLGINYDSTKNNTVMPSVQISSAGAANPVINDAAYVDGALTGCIDMVYWLPQLDTHLSSETIYHIDKVQVVSVGQAARVNYLYFLNQASTILSPQINTGSKELGTKANPTESNAYASADDLNGWRNAAAATVTMTGSTSYRVAINSNTSGVRTYTHNGKTYFDVVIPVRKWMNFSADSRTVQVEMYNAASGASGATGTGEVEFSMWGNNTGGTPMTYRDKTSATFHSHSLYEDLLFITGHSGNSVGQPYCFGSTTSAAASTMDIDKKYNSYYAYGKANLFDFIQSPYMKKAVYVSDEDALNYGWAYVSSFRITVPANTGTYLIASVQTRPIEDGLNDFTKNSAGEMVPDANSYDGGTGVQPIVKTGTVSTEPAAFGPHFYSSEYEITDLLDRSDKRNTMYGLYVRINTDGVNVRNFPGAASTSDTLKFVLPKDAYTPVFAKVVVNGSTLYALPAISSDGKSVSWGWFYGQYASVQSNPTGCQLAKDFGTYASLAKFQEAYPTHDSWVNAIYEAMQGKWVFSNYCYDKNSSQPAFGVNSADKYVKYYGNGEFGPIPTAYTEHRYVNSFNGLYSSENYKPTTQGSVDTIFETKQVSNTNVYGSAVRILANPVTVKKDDFLYYDISFGGYGSSTLVLIIATEDNKIHSYYVDTKNKTFIGYGSDSPNRVSGQERISFESIFTNHGLGDDDKIRVIGISTSTWLSSGTNNYTDSLMLRRLEVHSKQIDYKDRIEKNKSGTIIDAYNVLEDACNEKLTTQVAQAERGRRGWKIASQSNLHGFVFRPTLGHYRMSKTVTDDAKLVLNADRSISMKDYQYMYISFSMRNTDHNYGLEPTSTGNGISVTLKRYQGDNVNACTLNANGTFTYRPSYNSSSVALNYLPSLNTAVKLSSLTMASVSQIVINMKGPANSYFYINYLYFSNVPPTEGFQAIAERPFYHNYYLMDNTMGRYSRRFPTTTNPSGQVRSVDPTAADGRVNPLIIKRGQQFWTGTYYNGVPLDEFTSRDGTTYNVATSEESRNRVLASVFFYHDHADDMSSSTDGTGQTGDHLIDQYYQIGEGEKAFEQYEAYWCYNRWPTGWALERYIGFEGHHTEGPLMDLHATANNVFLRNGIEPVKYQTTFDTNGGQMTYFGSSDINADGNGLIENENNYYITNAVITDYFVWPTTNGKLIDPVKYGYKFKGWFTESQQENPNSIMQLQLYHTKQNPINITFYAHWEADTSVSGSTVTFKKADKSTTWFTRAANRDSEFTITIPWVTDINTASGKIPLVGWTVSGGDGKVYTPGMKVTVTKDTVFLPYTDTKHEASLTITVNNDAKLCLYKDSMNAADLTPIVSGYKGIKVTTSGSTTTYTNVPRYTVFVAKPNSTSNASSKAWKISDAGYTSFSVSNGTTTETIASFDTYYRFAASTDMTISYVSATDKTALVWTAPRAYVSNRQMMFYTQFAVPANATVVSYGTLYTKDSQYANIVGSATTNAEVASKLGDAMQFSSTACSATKTSAVRFVKATNKNDTNQFYLMVTENKGNAVTYYARGYVQYKVGSTTYVEYSDVISMAGVGASMDPLGD